MPRLPTVLFLLSLMTWTATAGALTLTDEERSWLAAHPDLRLGVDASWPPFEFRDDQGRYQGLAADYIDLIRQRLAIKLTPIEPVSWTVVLEQAKKAKLDLLPMQAGDVLATEADTSALESVTGFKPATPVEEGVRRFVDWYREFYRV